MATIYITVISELQDISKMVTAFAEDLEKSEFGFNNWRLTDLPSVYQSLLAWEEKNIEFIDESDTTLFYKLKNRVEKLVAEFQPQYQEKN